MVFFACRGEHTAYHKPVVYYSSARAQTFMETICTASLVDVGVRMEGYMIGGIESKSISQVAAVCAFLTPSTI